MIRQPSKGDFILTIITEPLFYVIAIPMVLIYGMSKGGLGPSLGAITVPALSFIISPVQAAAILLPILCVMDLIAIYRFRKTFSKPHLALLLPAGITGIIIATIFMGKFTPEAIKITIGVTVVWFCLDYWFRKGGSSRWILKKPAGFLLGTLSGFTSTQIHAGGPPLTMYLLPQKLDKMYLMGTFAIFFTTLNYLKLIPYTVMGFINLDNLMTSLVLMPLAPVGVLLGNTVLKKFPQKNIYRFLYIALFLSGLKLLWDGIFA